MLIRPFKARNPAEDGHRVSTPLELFFDLVTVVAIAAVTAAFHHQISHGHAAEAFLPFLFGVVAVWWVWLNYTWLAAGFDNDDTPYRVLTFVMMGGAAVFAGGAGYIFESLDARIGAIGWIIMRLALVALWLRAAAENPRYRRIALTYAAGFFVLQALWTLAFFLIEMDRTSFFAVGALLMAGEFAVPLIAQRLPYPEIHRHHMVERHGLLNIIVLGEIVLSASFFFGALHGASFNWALFAGGTITIAIVAMMWSYYFLEEAHIAATRNYRGLMRWGYFHVVIYLAGALFGAAAAAQFDALTHHSEATPQTLSLVTNGALALYIAGVWVVRDNSVLTGLPRVLPLIWAASLLVAGYLALPYWSSAAILFSALVTRMYAPERGQEGEAA